MSYTEVLESSIHYEAYDDALKMRKLFRKSCDLTAKSLLKLPSHSLAWYEHFGKEYLCKQ